MNLPAPSVSRDRRRVAGLVLAAALLFGHAPAARAQRDTLRDGPKVLAAFREVVAKPVRSVVRILGNDKDVALGTVVAGDGLVLTKASELSGKPIVKLKDGRALAATVVGIAEAYDLALLKVDAKGLTPIEWKSSKEAAPGDFAVSPGFDKDVAALGVVSVASRLMKKTDYPRVVNPRSGFLGIMAAPPGVDKSPGVKVGSVQKDTGAARGGIKADDVIVGIDSSDIKDFEGLLKVLGKRKAGDTITVRIKRGEEEKELKVTLGKRPRDLDRGIIQNNMGSKLSDRRTDFPMILQHDTVLRPEDCGGPLVELDGKAVGLNIARAGRTETYAIPSDTVQALLVELKSGKLAPKPEVVSTPTKSVAALGAAVKQAEEKLADLEKKSTAAAELLKQTEATKNKFGKTDPDLIEVYNKTRTYVEAVAKQVVQARTALEKARAELKKVQDEKK